MAQRNPIEDEPQFKVVHGYGEESEMPSTLPLDDESYENEGSLLSLIAGVTLILALFGMVAWWWTTISAV